MALRITTWNVNGIRNPFSYKPWSDTKSFQAMFDTLEADIVCIQETKIQRKDLRDDMVLVPGWDCFFTFPKYKKGYSGVAIYTRQSKCTPIRAEEGITGILELPGQVGKTYLSLPSSESIGGYPDLSRDKALLLDSEGRCIVLDFGGFVFIGVYSPATRDSTRDEFRVGFVAALCERIRRLVRDLKRRVVMVGDLNITRDEIDSAVAKEVMKGGELESYKETPTRKLLDNLLVPHHDGVMVDLCRDFFPDRLGMYTCWDTKMNARPGNYGSRIDYILCSSDMKLWFSEANIQEGLMGSDHCPVYGIINEVVDVGGRLAHILDLVNPRGTFLNGEQQPSPSPIVHPKLSGRLLPEFKSRQSIQDMFAKAGSSRSTSEAWRTIRTNETKITNKPELSPSLDPIDSSPTSQSIASTSGKISDDVMATKKEKTRDSPQNSHSSSSTLRSSKRQKIGLSHKHNQLPSSQKTQPPPRQQSLRSFFRPKEPVDQPEQVWNAQSSIELREGREPATKDVVLADPATPESELAKPRSPNNTSANLPHPLGNLKVDVAENLSGSNATNPTEAREQWIKLFNKHAPPRCDGHGEPCIQLVTKKPGLNCGRAFWICSRPVGPDGVSGNGNEWRCKFFVWSSDWNGLGS